MTTQSPDPINQVNEWLLEAKKTELNDADAACVATVDENGMPNARMVLIRKIDERGFVFYTNYESRKGNELLANPKAALCFHWKSLHRQIRVQGKVEKVSDVEADTYFNSRERSSRIGAWASEQSRPMESREALEKRAREFENKFNGIENPPRPPHWSGFRIVPKRIEFWQQKEFRLHDRLVYIKDGNTWETERLFP